LYFINFNFVKGGLNERWYLSNNELNEMFFKDDVSAIEKQ